MKKNLAVNYLLMCASWCLYLNRYYVGSIIVTSIACLLLVIKMRRINFVRSAFVFFVTYGALTFLYRLSTLSNFYSVFDEYSLLVALNVSMTNEAIKKATGNLNLIYIVNMLALTILMIVAVILPDSWYTIFTKTNIYTLISFIFLPNCLELSISLLSKEVHFSYSRV